MKLWIDDVRPAPEGYVWCRSVNGAKRIVNYSETMIGHYNSILSNEKLPDWIRKSTEKDLEEATITIIDIDHDAGDYVSDGGDYIRLLDWLEETGRNHPIRIHSANAVGVENMRRIIERNGWKEIRQ